MKEQFAQARATLRQAGCEWSIKLNYEEWLHRGEVCVSGRFNISLVGDATTNEPVEIFQRECETLEQATEEARRWWLCRAAEQVQVLDAELAQAPNRGFCGLGAAPSETMGLGNQGLHTRPGRGIAGILEDIGVVNDIDGMLVRAALSEDLDTSKYWDDQGWENPVPREIKKARGE